MKTCFKCGLTKALDEFYRHPATADKHLNKCKDCTRADTKMNYRARLDQYRAYDRARWQTPERREQNYAQRAKRRLEHPEKDRARTAVHNALRDGKLLRQACELCGSTVNVEAHHVDYSKPLDVRWLCRIHHREVEGRLALPLPF